MAVFDPIPPAENPPEFTSSRYSRIVPSVSQSEPYNPGIHSKDYIGEVAGAVPKALDLSLKRGLRDTIYDKVDQQRDQFTDALGKINSQIDTGTIAAPVQGTPSLLDSQPEANIPAGLANGLDRIKRLQLAQTQGSARINDTMYAANTLSIAKQLRAQYPGQRDFIDQQVSQASGIPVANAYYRSLIQDINGKLTQLGRRKDDVGRLMMNNLEVPGMDKLLVMRAQGDNNYPGDAFALHQISSWKQLQGTIKIDAAKRAEAKYDQTDIKQHDTQSVTKGLNDLVFHFVDNNLQLSGMPDLRSIINYMNDYQAGRVQGQANSDAYFQQREQQLQVYRNYIYQHAQKFASSYAPTVGEEDVQKIITNAMVPIDTYIKLANDKNAGPAYYHLHQLAAMKGDDQYNWLVSKDKGQTSRQLLVARGILGEQGYANVIQSMLIHGQDKPFADLFSQEALSSVAPMTDERGNPIPRYMTDAIQHAKDVSTPSHPITQDYYGSVFNWVTNLANPSVPEVAKDRMIDWAFNPKNIGILDKLKMEYRDPNTGQEVPGKYRAFNIMTSPKITAAIAQSAKSQPKLWEEYQNWTESSFNSLFRNDLATLNNAMKDGKGFHISFDDTTNQFAIVDGEGRNVAGNPKYKYLEMGPNYTHPNTGWYNVAQGTLSRINGSRTGGGLSNLANMMKHDPQGKANTHQYLLGLVQNILHDDPDNFAAQMMGVAIIQSQNPAMSPQDIVNKLLIKQ